jgi:polysaccharide export outer membrane protein
MRRSIRRALAGILAGAGIACAATAPPRTVATTPAAAPAAVALPAPAASPVPSADYRVGPGDVLEVEVFGNPDLSRTPTVQTNGMVALPLLGEVPVAGLTVAEVKSTLTSRLGRDFLVSPQVDVRVKEYQSQFVTLLGEVSAPGRRPLRGGQTRLIDVLVEAGGLTPRASGELVVSRSDGAFDDGTRTMRLQLGARTLTPEEERRLQLPLRAGDVISASPKYYVTVEGEVVRPGRYVLDTALTVSGAISSAGGLTRFGSQRVKVRRIDPTTGRVEIVEVDLKAVRKGDKPDPPLQANDTVSVSRRIL